MTDKEILIDGVDVSGCNMFSLSSEGSCGNYGMCAYNRCEYKHKNLVSRIEISTEQLKRKEQECEALKKKIENYKCSVNCYKYIEADRYRQALDEIKYEATEELKDLEADTNAYGCLLEIINIINKAKEVNNEK